MISSYTKSQQCDYHYKEYFSCIATVSNTTLKGQRVDAKVLERTRDYFWANIHHLSVTSPRNISFGGNNPLFQYQEVSRVHAR